MKLKGRLYSTVVRPALLYGSQCWTIYKEFESRITAAEMKMLRMTCGVTKMDHVRSTRIRGSLHIKKPAVGKLHDDRKNWYNHVLRRPPTNPVQQALNANIPKLRRRGKPQNTWVTQMKLLQGRQEQQERPRHRTDPSSGIA